MKTQIFALVAVAALIGSQTIPNDAIALDDSAPVVEVIEEKIIAEVPVATKSVSMTYEERREYTKSLTDHFGELYGVDAGSLFRTVTNENNTFEFCRQSGLSYKAGNRWGKAAGAREESYGLSQIHLPDNPTVTKEQACDPVFAVEFMAKAFSKGLQSRWMGYRG